MFKKTKRIRQFLGEEGIAFLEHALGSVTRLLPHVEVTKWTVCDGNRTRVTWSDKNRRAMKLVLVLLPDKADDLPSYSLQATLTRKKAPKQGAVARTLDLRERDLCERILARTSQVLHRNNSGGSPESLRAISRLFDEQIVSSHLQFYPNVEEPNFKLDLSDVFRELRILAEQSYENRSITFGCLLDPSEKDGTNDGAHFPVQVLKWKKYRALSDGYRTAYRISRAGKLIRFEDLIPFRPSTTGRHFYPEWADCMANASIDGVCGICLTRQGDLLVFDAGTLRFTYRFGRWQYWNHSHIVDLFRDRARAQRVPVKTIGAVVNSIYRATLDVSFRRCGGLFVLLGAQKYSKEMVSKGDAIGDRSRRSDKRLGCLDEDFDCALPSWHVQSMPRRLMVELAGLDGAVVLNNKGEILAYGAVLQPKKKGKFGAAEGSRTKAAIGASKRGIAVKISSDGEITFYEAGEKFLVT